MNLTEGINTIYATHPCTQSFFTHPSLHARARPLILPTAPLHAQFFTHPYPCKQNFYPPLAATTLFLPTSGAFPKMPRIGASPAATTSTAAVTPAGGTAAADPPDNRIAATLPLAGHRACHQNAHDEYCGLDKYEMAVVFAALAETTAVSNCVPDGA